MDCPNLTSLKTQLVSTSMYEYVLMHKGGRQTHWIETKDCDPLAREIADRHYSRKKIGSPKFVGPGDRLVLVTSDYSALFIWRKSVFRKDGQAGIECSLFRNEGSLLSSELIKEAVELAQLKWPGERLFTYVWDSKVRSSNPGFCYLKAGWRRCGRNKDGRLSILEMVS